MRLGYKFSLSSIAIVGVLIMAGVQTVDFEGTQHEFPKDFTQQEISDSLATIGTNEPQEIEDTEVMLDTEATALSSKSSAQEHMRGFSEASDFSIKNEGGYVNDPDDPGGETNFGISKRSYPEEDIKSMTRDRAVEIYQTDFWDKPKLGKLPDRLATKVFDTGINVGAKRGVLLLQRMLGVKGTGTINDATIKALRGTDEDKVIKQYITELKGYYKAVVKRKPTSKKFLTGWLSRAERLPEVIGEDS